ncbi:MAG: hypothetical protein IT580_00875 [Verrucomicrobiales bacterium]|nr:hypothetical protein [Verrucomicrobiales bacterium]
MKPVVHLASLVFVSTALCVAAQEATSPATEREGVTPATPAPAIPAIATPVRMPPAPAVSTEPVATEFTTPAGLREGNATVRRGVDALSQTNRTRGLEGAVPKLARPERKGIGGFFSGFANLFNPFAPVDKGSTPEATPAQQYDGQWNAAPLPRGFQDERYHEPQSVLIGGKLEGDPKKARKRKP